jgi:hypothetical protein
LEEKKELKKKGNSSLIAYRAGEACGRASRPRRFIS